MAATRSGASAGDLRRGRDDQRPCSSDLFREICRQGYTGSIGTVITYLRLFCHSCRISPGDDAVFDGAHCVSTSERKLPRFGRPR
jgi:hypothetical protein